MIDSKEKLIKDLTVVRVYAQYEDTKLSKEEAKKRGLDFRVARYGPKRGIVQVKTKAPYDFDGKAPFGIADAGEQKVYLNWEGKDIVVSYKDYVVREASSTITSLQDAYEVGGEDIFIYTNK